jgi:hypothetical protein
MADDKCTKRKKMRRLIRGEMTKRGIKGKDIAAQLGLCEMAVSKGCATSPRVVAALIEAGIPARLFPAQRRRGKKDGRQDAAPPETQACQTGI